MMHSSPMPLNIALDMTKRLHHELARHMTPEQMRDFLRIERLIAEAQKQHKSQLLQSKDSAATRSPEPASRSRSLWKR
jgi:hypothetical protein